MPGMCRPRAHSPITKNKQTKKIMQIYREEQEKIQLRTQGNLQVQTENHSAKLDSSKTLML